MKKIVVALFIISSVLISGSSSMLWSQKSKVNLTEYQKKEKERLKKLKEKNVKSSSFDDTSLKKLEGKDKLKSKNSFFQKDNKTVILGEGSATFEGPGFFDKLPEINTLKKYANRLNREIINSGIATYIILASLLISLFYLVVTWKIFTKAGYSGILSIIPIVNMYIMVKIADRSLLFFLLLFVPFLGFILLIIMNMDIARKFGYSAAFGLGLTFLGFLFYPVLAFGSSEYDSGEYRY